MNKLGLGIYSVIDQESNTTGRTVNIQFLINCVCVCVHVHVCEYSAYKWVCVHRACTCQGQNRTLSAFFCHLHLFALRQGPLLNQKLTAFGKAGWTGRVHDLPVSAAQYWSHKREHLCQAFFVSSGGSNSDPHISRASVVIHWATFSSSRKTSFVPLEFML